MIKANYNFCQGFYAQNVDLKEMMQIPGSLVILFKLSNASYSFGWYAQVISDGTVLLS